MNQAHAMLQPSAFCRRSHRRAGPLLVGLIGCAIAATGCATLKMPSMPSMPWAKKDADAEKHGAGTLGEDDESSVISSEYTPTEADAGWDYFKGDNIKKRWKKVV